MAIFDGNFPSFFLFFSFPTIEFDTLHAHVITIDIYLPAQSKPETNETHVRLTRTGLHRQHTRTTFFNRTEFRSFFLKQFLLNYDL